MNKMQLVSVLKKVSYKDIVGVFYTFLAFVPGKILKRYKSNILIISEREDEARDNGFWFFKYIVQNKDASNVYYAIKKNCDDYNNIKSISNNIIEFGSFKHCIYTWAANKYVSSQYSNGMPNRILYYLWIYRLYDLKFCFLQHGVTQNRSLYLEEPASRVSFLSCASEKEAQFMRDLGYSLNTAQITGFCRYDGLHYYESDEKQIFIMMTWRKYLSNCSEEEFKSTSYYSELAGLLNKIIKSNKLSNYKFLICFHPGMKKYKHLFELNSSNIKIIENSQYSFSELINKSKIFITDYSSIAFDFAYLKKEVLYFQFDLDEFREKHLQKGYFDYHKDGFGPVFSSSETLIKYLEMGYRINKDDYIKRGCSFFAFNDSCNCERNYNKIMRL